MSDNPQHIDEKDVFSQLIKEKLENHPFPVDESVWKGIEQKMAQSRKRAVIPVWYWISGSVAIALALLLILKPFSGSELTPAMTGMKHPEITISESNQQQSTQNQLIATAKESEVSAKTQYLADINLQKAGKTSTETRNANKVTTLTAENRNNEKTSTHLDKVFENQVTMGENKTGTAREPITETPDTKETTVKTKNTAEKTEITSLPDLNDYPELPAKTTKNRQKRPLLIAAAVGSGGAFASPVADAPMNDMYMSSPNLVKREIATNYASVLDANDYSEAKHDLPLSVGVTLVKPLNRIFSLESGLVYTYLKSEYFRPGSTNYRGILQLHYLGIPLNVRAKLLDQPKWNLYLSAGGMVEKGLRSSYVQEITNELATTNTAIKSGIEGVQWSVNGALGVDYKIRKDLSLFVEPKLTYYLLNNQPRSARTEQPLTIGLNGGLRIEL